MKEKNVLMLLVYKVMFVSFQDVGFGQTEMISSTDTSHLVLTVLMNHLLEDHWQRASFDSGHLSLFYRFVLKQEDLLDLITTLVKLNLFFSTTVAMQCTFQSSPWWLTDYYTHHITWSKKLLMNERKTNEYLAINIQHSSVIVKI